VSLVLSIPLTYSTSLITACKAVETLHADARRHDNKVVACLSKHFLTYWVFKRRALFRAIAALVVIA